MNNRDRQNLTHMKSVNKMAPPVKILIKNAPVTLLDTCPKVKIITVPAPVYPLPEKTTTKTETAQGGKILPPEMKAAGLYVHMKNFNTAQGLALSSIGCCCMDHLGNLWFGTYGGGVSRFDGESFTNFTVDNGLPDNYIHSICEDKNGNMWFGTDGGGISCYDGKRFTTYDETNGLADNTVYSIFSDSSGKIWIGTIRGLCYINQNGKRGGDLKIKAFSAEHQLPELYILSIFQDKKGNLWWGTNKRGLWCFNGKTITTYTRKQGLISNTIWCLAEDKEGKLWIGTDAGASCFDGRYFTNYEKVGSLPNIPVRTIYEDRKRNMWFGTDEGGVSFLSWGENKANRARFVNYNTAQGLAGSSVFSIVDDNQGNMWFGFNGDGVDCYSGCQAGNNDKSGQGDEPLFTTFTTAQGLPATMATSIFEDGEGSIWLGTEGGGICKYNGKSFATYGLDQGLPGSTVTCISAGLDGEMWFNIAGAGVACFSQGKGVNSSATFSLYTPPQGISRYTTYYIYKDKKDNMWFCTYGGGIERFDGKSITRFTAAQGLASDLVLGMTEDNNDNMWFCTYGGGVSKYDGAYFTNYTTAQGLASNKVNSAMRDRCGNLWFCTYGGGVSRFDGKSFITFNSSCGLSDDMVTQIVQDSNGKIFLGTNKGISVLTQFQPAVSTGKFEQNAIIPAVNKLSNDELSNYHPLFEIYNEQRGYPIKDIYFSQNSMFMDSKHIIWASNGDARMGLVRFDYTDLRKDLAPPKILIRDIKINGEKVCWYTITPTRSGSRIYGQETSNSTGKGGAWIGDSATLAQQESMTYGRVLSGKERDTVVKNFAGVIFDSVTPYYPLPVGLVLPYSDNNITFEFSAIEPARSFLVKYRYILKGYDRSWSPTTDKSEATFGNMGEGAYTFEVQAQSPDGIWSELILYSFRVLPPWYRTWWAYGSYTLLAFLVLLLLFRWRTAALRKEKYLLEQKVRERTAEAVKQKRLVEEKNRDILDSITYAKRLQDAILPPLNLIEQYFPESFVLYKPKDIVAGDFYWVVTAPSPPQSEIKEQDVAAVSQSSPPAGVGTFPAVGQGVSVLIAACDCTGHGVPGAMVSVVCSNALNRAVKEFKLTDPGKILDKVRELVLETFFQKDGTGENGRFEIQDGMDISLASLSPSEGGIKVQWSGAYNPLWYTAAPPPIPATPNRTVFEHPIGWQVGLKLIEIPADKQSIGKTDNPKPFTTHTFHIPLSGATEGSGHSSRGACIYLFTDGYADQFGGPYGKKFKYKQFEELLIANADKTMDEQKAILEQRLHEWKGNLEQVDDILIIGIRV